MKEYLINKYVEHYKNMVGYMNMYGLAFEKKVEYEYGACSAIARVLTDLNLATTEEVINLRNSISLKRRA